MFKHVLLCVSLSALTFCKPAGSTKSNKSAEHGSRKEVKISVSSAGLITVENCETSYTVKLVNTALADHPNFKGVQCKIDLVSWVDKPDKGDPYVILSSNQTLNSKVKGSFYAVSTHIGQYKAVDSGINVCNLTACGKEIYLLDTDFRPSEIVLGDLAPGSNIVNLKFADNHGLNHHMDSEIDVVVQQWDKDKELYIANPLKNRKK